MLYILHIVYFTYYIFAYYNFISIWWWRRRRQVKNNDYVDIFPMMLMVINEDDDRRRWQRRQWQRWRWRRRRQWRWRRRRRWQSTLMTTSTFIYDDMDRISVTFASCDIRTDGRTDIRTDKARYRDARTHLKTNLVGIGASTCWLFGLFSLGPNLCTTSCGSQEMVDKRW